jgi:hypothetical protein
MRGHGLRTAARVARGKKAPRPAGEAARGKGPRAFSHGARASGTRLTLAYTLIDQCVCSLAVPLLLRANLLLFQAMQVHAWGRFETGRGAAKAEAKAMK